MTDAWHASSWIIACFIIIYCANGFIIREVECSKEKEDLGEEFCSDNLLNVAESVRGSP